MSELIEKRVQSEVLQKHLLATVSALTLVAYVASAEVAQADDAERPTVWIELGGQAEFNSGMTQPFSAPFMSLKPSSNVYDGISFLGSQKAARASYGEEGKLIFQPEDSDWKFTAGVRYGRSNATRNKHRQEAAPPAHYNFDLNFTFYGYPYSYHYEGTKYLQPQALADTRTKVTESHFVLDFQAGKDVGLGLFGRNGSSTINAGIRFASFSTRSHAYITARPDIGTGIVSIPVLYGLVHIPVIHPTFHQYTLIADTERSFRGIGPSASWDASASLWGSKDRAQLTVDWGVDAAILFGRQKANVSHTTKAYQLLATGGYPQLYSRHRQDSRSHSAVVPNLGGFVGLSVRYPNAKVSFGYRADWFFGAMDDGIDSRSTKDVGFHGPFATVSIGFP